MRPLRATLFALAIFPFLAIPKPGIADASFDLDQAKALIRRGDAAAARPALERLAESGNAAAQTELGLLYYGGRGVTADEMRAYALFERAAAGEEREAMFLLGRMNLLGEGPARSNADADRDAARWFFEAARRGHADAQYHLGLLFYAGTGVEKNTAEALKWIERAAANGHEAARRFGPAKAGDSR